MGFTLLREFSLLHLIMRQRKVAVGISISCMHWIKINLPVKMKCFSYTVRWQTNCNQQVCFLSEASPLRVVFSLRMAHVLMNM